MATGHITGDYEVLQFTATTTARSSNDIILISETPGICLVDIAASGTGSVAVSGGRWNVTKKTDANLDVGQAVFKHASAASVTAVATSNAYMGCAYSSATTGATTVNILLGVGGGTT